MSAPDFKGDHDALLSINPGRCRPFRQDVKPRPEPLRGECGQPYAGGFHVPLPMASNLNLRPVDFGHEERETIAVVQRPSHIVTSLKHCRV